MIRKILVSFAVQYIRAQRWRRGLMSEAHFRLKRREREPHWSDLPSEEWLRLEKRA